MNRFLKGNYKIDVHKEETAGEKEPDFAEIFENRAAQKLGGSIAFVMKSNKFTWDGEEDAE